MFWLYFGNENMQIEDAEVPDEEMSDKIFDELIKLPIKYQSIYDLYYFEHLEIEEIAKIKVWNLLKLRQSSFQSKN